MKVRLCPQCQSINGVNAWNCDGCGATLSVETIIDTTENQVELKKAEQPANSIPQRTQSPPQPVPKSPQNTRFVAKIDQALGFLQRANPAQRWEYILVECLLHKTNGFYIYTINNALMDTSIELHLFLAYVGQQGWELVSTTQAERSIDKRSVSLGELFRGDTATVHQSLVILFKYPLVTS
jgi:hypothetical protein